MELQRAYNTLTDEQQKLQYDRWLDGGAIVPFDTWMSLQSTHSVSGWNVDSETVFNYERRDNVKHLIFRLHMIWVIY